MKMKVFFICVIFILVATFYLLPGFTQDFQDFLPEGARARIGGEFRCLAVLRINDWTPVVHLWDFDYLPDSRRLVVVDSVGISLYDADTAEKLNTQLSWRYSRDHNIRGILVGPDGRMVFGDLSGNIKMFIIQDEAFLEQRFIKISNIPGLGREMGPTYVPIAWINQSGYRLATVKEKFEAPGTLSFSSRIHVSNSEGTFREAVSEHKPENKPYLPRVENVRFHGSTTVASVSHDSIIHIWESASRTQKFMWYYPRWLSDGKGDFRHVLGFETDTGIEFSRTLSPNNTPSGGMEAIVTAKDYYKYPSGIEDVYALPLDFIRHPANTINLYEYGNIHRLKHTFIGHTGCIWNIVYSEDGEWLASASVDGTIRVWNPRVGHEVQQFNSHTLHFSNMAFSPDGQTLAVGEWDGTIWFYPSEPVSGALGFKGHTGPVTSVAFHPNLPILATASTDGNLRVWSLETDTPAQIKHDLLNRNVPLTSVAFSPDGRKLAVGRWARSPGTTLVVLERRGGHVIGEPLGVTYEISDQLQLDRHWESVMGVAFSPDGETLAAGGAEGAVHLWAINSEEDIQSIPRVLPRHKDSVFKVVFSPDGKTLASGSDDGTVLLWDIELVSPWDPTDPSKPEDVNGDESSPQADSPTLKDVSGDGEVNIIDLVLVSANLGKIGENVADVNQDGVVNIQDLVLVAGAMGKAPAAPAVWHRDLEFPLTRTEVAQWLAQAQQLNLTESTSQEGIRFLEELLAALTPQETALLANYPNPFNPETWIPYRLSVSADVTVRIYAMDGSLIRTLVLGYQAAGIYQSRSRAAYWDGKNELGEPVASGPYFYTLTAGEFSATRKLLIQK